MGNKDTEFFNGFERDEKNSFSYNEDLWKNLLSDDELRNLLCINTEDTPLRKKKGGSLSWAADGFLILNMNKEKKAKDYKADWLKTLTGRQLNHSRLEEIFKKFIGAVPNEAADMGPLSMYFQAIRETAQYLQEVLRRCADAPGDKQRELLAAGLYSMICLVMQNGKYYKKGTYPILCRRPPNQYDPLADWEPPVIIKNDRPKITIPPEIPLYQDSYDFWGVLRSRFPEPEERKNPAETESDIWDGMIKVITPAQIHRTRTHLSKEVLLPVIYSPDTNTQSFLAEKIPVLHDGKWRIGVKLHGLPQKETTANRPANLIRLEKDGFSDETVWEGMCLSIHKHQDRYSCEFFSILDDHFCFGIQRDWKIELIRLNENGHIRDSEVEQATKAYGIQLDSLRTREQAPEKTFVCKFDHDFLRFLFLNPDTMEEIPKKTSQDPITGKYMVSVTVRCPGRLVVLKYDSKSSDQREAVLLALEGYLHGLYGLEKDPQEAKKLMQDGAFHDNPYMAFEFGAMLKEKGSLVAAEAFLELAAVHQIPGAKFLLAEVLKEMGSTEKARALIDDLWAQGYRTYGLSQSIDLLKEHEAE